MMQRTIWTDFTSPRARLQALKCRRHELITRATTRQERQRLLPELRQINREVRRLERR